MNAPALAVFGTITVALALPPVNQSRRTVHLEGADCSQINMQFGDLEVARAEQRVTVPLAAGVLDVQPEANGGIRIQRGTGRDYSITACVAAGAVTMGEAQQAADAVRIAVEGSRVRVENAARANNWNVQFVIEAPDGARITAETSNGPIGVDGASGQFNLRASNGPIGLDDVSGEVTARAANGPISVDGSRGNFDVETSNGPISVTLQGTRWDGRLDARAHNGPLTVRVPDQYQSGIEISSSEHSPWSCRIAACRSGNRDWDDRSRSLRVGPDPVVVKISTVNGPVTVRDR
jgi:DUF4097 and DUF4098 domain-containing protein YvlB